jgi:hypothetical protein
MVHTPHPKAALQRGKPTYSVEKLGFSVLALFRQPVIESDNCQQVCIEPNRDDSGKTTADRR